MKMHTFYFTYVNVQITSAGITLEHACMYNLFFQNYKPNSGKKNIRKLLIKLSVFILNQNKGTTTRTSKINSNKCKYEWAQYLKE